MSTSQLSTVVRTPRRGSATVLTVVTALSLSACAMNPVSGQRELALVSESQEIAMGRQGSAEAIASIGLVSNAPLQSYVNRIGQQMARGSERPQLAWEFHVLDDASVNAFAMPGGFIFVTRGLLAHMTNEAQLASVIGHEIGHVTARHSVQQMSRQQVASLGLGVGSILSPTIAEYAQVASVGMGLFFLKYGRDHETQADQLGFRYALADGYDTREMAAVFETLRRDAQLAGQGRLPEWQSSHPDPGNRIQAVEQMVAASPQNYGALKVAEEEFLRQIDGMVYGENPRLGYFQNALFLHPDLQFKLTFPNGWATQNSSNAVTAVSPNGDGVVQLRAAEGSAAEAANSFLSQAGLTAGARSTNSIHGNRAVMSEFSARVSETESVRGMVAFIEYGGATWGIMGYSLADRFATYRPAILSSLGSFERLTDPVALGAQPMRLRIEHASRAMSLQQFNTQTPSSLSLAELALINGLAENAQLRAGQPVKRVTGTPMR